MFDSIIYHLASKGNHFRRASRGHAGRTREVGARGVLAEMTWISPAGGGILGISGVVVDMKNPPEQDSGGL
jgi:hypothetical protein